MYAIRLDVDPRLGTNSALREYARTEYGRDEIAWILAAAKAPRRKLARPSFAARFRIGRARPARRSVACKGSPRNRSSEESSPG